MPDLRLAGLRLGRRGRRGTAAKAGSDCTEMISGGKTSIPLGRPAWGRCAGGQAARCLAWGFLSEHPIPRGQDLTPSRRVQGPVTSDSAPISGGGQTSLRAALCWRWRGHRDSRGLGVQIPCTISGLHHAAAPRPLPAESGLQQSPPSSPVLSTCSIVCDRPRGSGKGPAVPVTAAACLGANPRNLAALEGNG